MGGQACVLYGGAEFSRDTDLAIVSERENLSRLQHALADLDASCIAVPPFEKKYLDMGLAVHFRCQHPEAPRMRIDVMSKMRGVDEFPALWERRTTLVVSGIELQLLALPDLVQSKKTQRDKDWPMIKRLVEANYFANRHRPLETQIVFWLRELRTAALLQQVIRDYPRQAAGISSQRSLLHVAVTEPERLDVALREEQDLEREQDRAYWAPLRKELERLRNERRA